jgi:hypothetical protein
MLHLVHISLCDPTVVLNIITSIGNKLVIQRSLIVFSIIKHSTPTSYIFQKCDKSYIWTSQHPQRGSSSPPKISKNMN